MILKIQNSLIYLWLFYRLEFPRLNDLVYVHYNLGLWIKQTDAISLDNIDILSTWRVEAELPIIEAAPSWLEELEAQERQEQEENEDEEAEEDKDEDDEDEDEDEEDEEQEEDEEGDVQASTPATPSSREIVVNFRQILILISLHFKSRVCNLLRVSVSQATLIKCRNKTQSNFSNL